MGRITGLRERSANQRTYSLTVAEAHTFFVGDGPWLVHNAGCTSIKGRLRDAQLPNQGRIRFIPPEGYTPSNPLYKGSQGGFIDKFGNEWVKGPSRIPGHPFEEDVQLSNQGRNQLGWLSRDGTHLNVSLDGEITHK